MSGELVSVIIPRYYWNDLLREAIRSAQDQTHDEVEVIVVDDSGERHAESVVTTFDEVTYDGDLLGIRPEGCCYNRLVGVRSAWT